MKSLTISMLFVLVFSLISTGCLKDDPFWVKEEREERESQNREDCFNYGGVWDAENKECLNNKCDPNPCGNGTCRVAGYHNECICDDGYIIYEDDYGNQTCILPPCGYGNRPCKDYETNHIWSTRSKYDMSWENANAYCNNLNEGGYSDWILPSIDILSNTYSETSGKFWSSSYRTTNQGEIEVAYAEISDKKYDDYYDEYVTIQTYYTTDSSTLMSVYCVK